MQNQVYVFAIFILNGFIIGILFDIFRIFRKSFKTPDFITYIEDILFWILSALLLLYSIFKFNNGELRMYIFLGIISGFLVYFLIFSKLFVDISVYTIKLIKKLINMLIIVPFKFFIKIINKIIYKPTIFLCINMTKLLKKIIYFPKKSIFSHKNFKSKKDFVWICRNI